MDTNDRKMFAPVLRGEALSIEAKLYQVLRSYDAGATAARLAEEFVRSGLAIGSRAPITKRIMELLEELERGATVERIPDGRYRVVKTTR